MNLKSKGTLLSVFAAVSAAVGYFCVKSHEFGTQMASQMVGLEATSTTFLTNAFAYGIPAGMIGITSILYFLSYNKERDAFTASTVTIAGTVLGGLLALYSPSNDSAPQNHDHGTAVTPITSETSEPAKIALTPNN